MLGLACDQVATGERMSVESKLRLRIDANFLSVQNSARTILLPHFLIGLLAFLFANH